MNEYAIRSRLLRWLWLALEDFSCLSSKSMALTLLAKFIPVLISIMKLFSMPAPNTYVGLALDFLAHFSLNLIDIARSIKACCALTNRINIPVLIMH